MKIEKVNDHQIRCTLTKADLIDRELKISELAYGTEKAKNLFRDMMKQASTEFGFEAEDIPLMIEAIPLSPECIVLIITKVEDPEELDTRFSKFAPSIHEEDGFFEIEDDEFDAAGEAADDILNLFRKLQETDKKERAAIAKENGTQADLSQARSKSPEELFTEAEESQPKMNVLKLYSFDSLDQLIHLAHVLKGFYNGQNSVYKDTAKETYKLIIRQSEHSTKDFNRVCNVLAEYGHYERFSSAYHAYLDEHFEPLRKGDALQALAEL